MVVGLDTGFFVRLLDRQEEALRLWEQLRVGDIEGVISCITLYELIRVGLRGRIRLEIAERLTARLPHVCSVVWLERPELLNRAARIAHGNGLAMADALILTSLTDAGAERVYTTDTDLQAYSTGPEIILL